MSRRTSSTDGRPGAAPDRTVPIESPSPGLVVEPGTGPVVEPAAGSVVEPELGPVVEDPGPPAAVPYPVPVRPAPYPVPGGTAPPGWGGTVPPPGFVRRWQGVLLVAGTVLAVLLAGAVVVVSAARWGPGPGAGPDPGPDTVAARPSSVTADCVSPGSRDSLGTPTSYEPGRAVDGDVTTAWRCPGSGEGVSLVLAFPGPAVVHRIGIIPGLAKTDPGDGTDRYAQNRRISRLDVVGDDGVVATLDLDTSPGDRAPQWASVGPVTTRHLTLRVVSSVPGSPQGQFSASDTVAISEVELE